MAVGCYKKHHTMATYVDVTVILCASNGPDNTSNLLQIYLDSIYNWITKWRININPDKSVSCYVGTCYVKKIEPICLFSAIYFFWC